MKNSATDRDNMLQDEEQYQNHHQEGQAHIPQHGDAAGDMEDDTRSGLPLRSPALC